MKKKDKRSRRLSMSFTCNQRWEQMTPCEGGRFCEQCQKTVYDFRGLTAEEIIHRQLEMGGKVCGIYDRKVVSQTPPPMPASGLWRTGRPYLLSLLGLFSAGAVAAQTEPLNLQSPETVEAASARQIAAQQLVDRNEGIFLRGRLTDAEGKPLALSEMQWIQRPLLRIGLEAGEGRYSCQTDEQGMFLLELTDLFEQTDQLELSVSAPGYLPAKVQVNKSDMPEEKLKLSFTVFDLGEVQLQRDTTADHYPLIEGTVVEADGKDLLIGVQAALYKNGDLLSGAISDWDGKFSIEIPEDVVLRDTDEVRIVFSYVGYEQKVYTFTGAAFQDFLKAEVKTWDGAPRPELVATNVCEVVVGGLVRSKEYSVTGAVIRPPLHKRIWYKLKRSFRRRR